MFTINPQCNLPFHIPLTEAVISHGGTLELVRILDRVGPVASIEAHERLIKRVVKACKANGMQNELTPGAFCVVSVDNLDISQCHAQVYVTSSQRSWHGTSIQCTEPKPNSNKVTTPTTNGPISNTAHESMAPLQNSCSTRSEGMEPLRQTHSMRTHCLTTSNSEGMEPLGQMQTHCLTTCNRCQRVTTKAFKQRQTNFQKLNNTGNGWTTPEDMGQSKVTCQ